MARNKITVSMTLDASDFRRALGNAGNETKKTGKKVKSLGVTIAKLAAGFLVAKVAIAGFNKTLRGLKTGFVASIKAASDFQEAASKFDVVFKGVSKRANEMREDLVNAFGQSRIKATEFLASLQDTFVPMGFARDRAAEMSGALVKLAIDVGSFQNKATPDVIRDFQSALVGNTETVRKYGIIITEARIKQEAMTRGLNPKALTQQQKTFLRMNIIFNDSKDAFGNFALTQTDFANATRTLNNRLSDLALQVGTGLLPPLGKLLATVTPLVDNSIKWAKANKDVINNAVLSGFGVLLDAIGSIGKGVEFAVKVFFNLRKNIAAVQIIGLEAAGLVSIAWENAGKAFEVAFAGIKASGLRTFSDLINKAAQFAAFLPGGIGVGARLASASLSAAAKSAEKDFDKLSVALGGDVAQLENPFQATIDGLEAVKTKMTDNIGTAAQFGTTFQEAITRVNSSIQSLRTDTGGGAPTEGGEADAAAPGGGILDAIVPQPAAVQSRLDQIKAMTESFFTGEGTKQAASFSALKEIGEKSFEGIGAAISQTAFLATQGAEGIKGVWTSLGKTLVKVLIDSLIKIAASFFTTAASAKAGASIAGSAEVGKAVSVAGAEAFKSVIAALPFPANVAVAPGVAAAAISGAAGAATAGKAAGSFVGVFKDGSDSVRATGLAMVHKNERIFTSSENQQIIQLLRGASGGGSSITVNIEFKGPVIGDDQFRDDLTSSVVEALEERRVQRL